MSVRVTAPCRLHFGLFHVPVEGLTHWPDGTPIRKFGGVGMMVETPSVSVTVRPADDWSAGGSLAERASPLARLVRHRVDDDCDTDDVPEAFVVVAGGPTEHTGLGVGTALGMSVTAAISRIRTDRKLSWVDLQWMANICERGQRSAIGLYGFASGGLIVDGGKERAERISRLESRTALPSDWRVVLIRPPVDPKWFGDTERAAFGRNRSAEQALDTTRRLYVIASSRLVPAVQDANFDDFSAAVFEFNRLAGEPFAADQGGPYAGMEVTCVVDELLSWGVTGVGQSSWGPTVFAFARDPDEAEHLARRARAWLPSDADVTVTAANNTGAKLEVL